MSTLKIDPTTGDLAFTNNSLVIETGILAETKQRLKAKFGTFLGEWFNDETLGLPYYQDILVKNPDLNRIKSIYREIVLDDEQVDSLVEPVEALLNTVTRELTVTFAAKLNDGTYLEFAEAILRENR